MFVVVSQDAKQQPQHKPIGQFDSPIINGFVFAFDLADGKSLWPGPATVRNRGMTAQPEDIPLLVFADRETTNEGSRSGRLRLRLLCLDKQTGETVYRNDELPDGPATRFRIRGEREDAPRVVVQTNANTIQLTLTDQPRPPRPPANDDVEAPRAAAERGLVELGQRLGAALRGTIAPHGEKTPRQRDTPEPPREPPADNIPPPVDDDD
jgi:hypothetical protein